jgi:hypothetical protein
LTILNRFLKTTQLSNFIKIHPVGAELFHAADRQTVMTKLTFTFWYSVYAPKNTTLVQSEAPDTNDLLSLTTWPASWTSIRFRYFPKHYFHALVSYMRSEVYMVVNHKIVVSWVLRLNILAHGYQCFGETCLLSWGSACQEITIFVWKLKDHCCIHSNQTMILM